MGKCPSFFASRPACRAFSVSKPDRPAEIARTAQGDALLSI